MKKFVNIVDEILSESLTGFGAAHDNILEVKLKPDFIARKSKPSNPKVALQTISIEQLDVKFLVL